MYTSRITHLIALVLICLTYLVAFETPRPAAQVEQRHPLDPLTETEINAALGVLSAAPGFPDNALFATIVLKEPAKSEVLSYAPGRALARQAFAVILDRRQNRTIEAVVDLETTRVASWNEVKGVQPVVLEAEHEVLVRVVKSDARWLESIRKRGINNPDDVQIDYWAVGQVAPQYQGRRLLRAVSYFKGDSTNFYGRPIEGVGVLVDMNAERVVEFVDSGALPVPPASQELDEKSTGVREAPKALTIAQPDGASFTVSGQEIRWQKWRFRYTMHPREGLVLHTIGYEDEGRVRPIMYRASISEMAVPYGDPDRNWRWRSAFDVGEYGMGRLASPIEANTDAPSNARLIDVTFAGDDGRAYVLPRAVGIYERDGGMLWKHYELFEDQRVAPRAGTGDLLHRHHRQLRLRDQLDLPPGRGPRARRRADRHHAAERCTRAESDRPRHIREVRASRVGQRRGAASPALLQLQARFRRRWTGQLDLRDEHPRATGRTANPSLNGMIMEETTLRTEAEAQRQMHMGSARTWAIKNPDAQNALGHHTSYILVPGVNSIPYIAATSQVRRRAAFINRHFWATRYHGDEMYAAGSYPNQSRGGAGLPKWVANNEPLSRQDVVVWYTMGITHIPRPEEWPVMPVTHVGFKLIPGGFFSRNPALDVPR